MPSIRIPDLENSVLHMMYLVWDKVATELASLATVYQQQQMVQQFQRFTSCHIIRNGCCLMPHSKQLVWTFIEVVTSNNKNVLICRTTVLWLL